MNLAWIAAVLRPRAVAPHPNFPDEEYEQQPVAQLAAVVLGYERRGRRGEHGDIDSVDSGVRNAERSMLVGSLHEGLDGLTHEILTASHGDPARVCALALLACTAAAEIDDYDRCDQILSSLLGRIEGGTSETDLLRAVILQQFSLRLCDSGRSGAEKSIEAAQLLERVDVHDCREFPLGRGLSESYKDTLAHIVMALKHAAWSLVPSSDDEVEREEIPSWQEIVRSQASEQLLQVERLRSDTYSRFLEGLYSRSFRSGAISTIWQLPPDLFRAALPYELFGHSRAYQARKELALMRLLESDSGSATVQLSDSLRLLRHAGALTELDRAVERIRAAGPLSALSSDARQIMLRRAKPHMLRDSELRVLRGAAELMTADEAAFALIKVFEVLDEGGPPVPPGKLQSPVVGFEAASRAAVALANVAGQEDIIADRLLEVATSLSQGDELWDRAIARALNQLSWKGVSEKSIRRWSRWYQTSKDSLSVTAEVIESFVVGDDLRAEEPISNLSAAASRINALIRGSSVNVSDIAQAVDVAKRELEQIRGSAVTGRHSFATVDAADVAAALICHAGLSELWEPLIGFLLDTNVFRDHKNRAFERLASERPQLPHEGRLSFRSAADDLLTNTNAGFAAESLVPYPEALRFLACYDLMNEPEAFSCIARLAGQSDRVAREQAARTVAAVASVNNGIWVSALALQLSHDSDVNVKAHAARGLALLAVGSMDSETVALERLSSLLNEDGMLVPFYVTRQLQQAEQLPQQLLGEIRRLGDRHPSSMVRSEAISLVGKHDSY